jgi:HAD superfamily hydrolase (TIGR01509 family)
MLETEGPSYESWRELLAEHGHEFALDTWSATVGTFDVVDPIAILERHLGRPVDGDALRRRRMQRKLELIAGQALRPGVERLVAQARGRGLRTAIVTSASRAWVDEHLRRVGLDAGWDCVVGAEGDRSRAKPAPTVYLEALERLGLAAHEAVAVEDSPNGIRAAKRAGLTCIAFPNPITRRLDLSEADAIVEDLDTVTLDDLLAAAAPRPTPEETRHA